MLTALSRKLENRRWQKIPGWLSKQDAEIFDLLLNFQKDRIFRGDVLEIGAYQGKSAILLGKFMSKEETFIVCDSFGLTTQTENNFEILTSYPTLNRNQFERNYLNFHQSLPKILQIDSLELAKFIQQERFRFIHIDGSHLYDYAKSDLEFAIKHIIPDYGIIVLDDFRAQHTLGVAKAFWELIFNNKCQPLIFSAAKVYLVQNESTVFSFSQVRELFIRREIPFEEIRLFGVTSLRVLGQSDGDLYSINSWRNIFPPMILILARKLLRRGN